jgi:L-ascorbate metabolism protein UlaG (beta-lactamase superfamily)
MKITWLGHAAFLIETATPHGAVRIITDPYSSKIGYDPIDKAADVVTLSHENPKYHSCLDDVQGDPHLVRGLEMLESGAAPVETHGLRLGAVQVYEKFDFETGQGEGPNAMMWLESEGLRVLHMGDVGHRLTDEHVTACGPVDVLLAAAGGPPTIELPDLKSFIDRLRPVLVLPMHYGTDKIDLNIVPVTELTVLFDPAQVRHDLTPTMEVSRATLPQSNRPFVVVLPSAR